MRTAPRIRLRRTSSAFFDLSGNRHVLARFDTKPPHRLLQREAAGAPYLPRKPDLAAALGAGDERTSFGASTVPLSKKLGSDVFAGDVVALSIEERMRKFSVREKSMRPSAWKRPCELSKTKPVVSTPPLPMWKLPFADANRPGGDSRLLPGSKLARSSPRRSAFRASIVPSPSMERTRFLLKIPKRATVSYHEKPVQLTFPNDAENTLDVGKVLLTHAGQELATLCGAKPVEGFFEFVCERWRGQGLIPKEATAPSTSAGS